MVESRNISIKTTAAAIAMAALGLFVGGTALWWITGTFALSAATGTAIWKAFEVGGWALTAALMVFSGGTSAAIYAALRAFIAKLGKKAAQKAFIA
ncbi:MAG: hypothetical protein LBJ02_08200 [Bifidobacteriaceae bacterium]|jgi:hypothetical protein|nr:hypothetical protein [Bifidobacteriaceae bacterium]